MSDNLPVLDLESTEEPPRGPRSRRGRPVGRPTKLTPETQAKIVRAIVDGNFQVTAARLAGVSESAFHDWMAKGLEARALVEDGHRIDPGQKRYLEFAEAVEEARAMAEALKVAALSRIAEGREVKTETVIAHLDGTRQVIQVEYHRPDVRALEIWLRQSFPRTWGKQAIEHTGPGGGPIPIEVEVSARESVATKLKLVRDRIDKPKGEEEAEAG